MAVSGVIAPFCLLAAGRHPGSRQLPYPVSTGSQVPIIIISSFSLWLRSESIKVENGSMAWLGCTTYRHVHLSIVHGCKCSVREYSVCFLYFVVVPSHSMSKLIWNSSHVRGQHRKWPYASNKQTKCRAPAKGAGEVHKYVAQQIPLQKKKRRKKRRAEWRSLTANGDN